MYCISQDMADVKSNNILYSVFCISFIFSSKMAHNDVSGPSSNAGTPRRYPTSSREERPVFVSFLRHLFHRLLNLMLSFSIVMNFEVFMDRCYYVQ